MTFRVRRIETIKYWVDYERDEVLDILSTHGGAIDADIRSELDEMDDGELANYFGEELRSGIDAIDRVIEDSERYADVQGSDFDVYELNEVAR